MPGWLPFLSKLLALMGVQVLLSAVLLVCGVLVQLSKGYTHLELGLYLTDLFGFRLLDLWQLCRARGGRPRAGEPQVRGPLRDGALPGGQHVRLDDGLRARPLQLRPGAPSTRTRT